MKVLKKRWMLFYSKVLAAGLTLMGFVSCHKESEDMYGTPLMYGPPPFDSTYIDTTCHTMYGVTQAPYKNMDLINQTEQPDQPQDGE